MSNMENSFIPNISLLLNKTQLECYMGDCIKINGELELLITESLLNSFKEGGGINHTILEFCIIDYLNKNSTLNRSELASYFILSSQLFGKKIQEIKKEYSNYKILTNPTLENKSILNKRFLICPFEVKDNIWNLAVIENLNMLFKDDFLSNNNLIKYKESEKPIINIFMFDKLQINNQEASKIFIENLYVFLQEYVEMRYNCKIQTIFTNKIINLKLSNFEIKTHKIVHCSEAINTGFVILKIMNEILFEEDIKHFLSTYDFNSFCTDSLVINMRDIIKNKIIEYLNKLKKEASIVSGTRKTVSFKNKSEIEKKKEIIELMKPRKTSLMKSNIHSLDSRKVMNLVIDEYFNKSEPTSKINVKVEFKNNIAKNNRIELKSFYAEITESINESRISCISKDFKQGDLFNSEDDLNKENLGNILNASDFDKKMENEERFSHNNSNRLGHQVKYPDEKKPFLNKKFNDTNTKSIENGDHRNNYKEDFSCKEEKKEKEIFYNTGDHNNCLNQNSKLPIINENNKDTEKYDSAIYQDENSNIKPQIEVKEEIAPESKVDNKQDGKLIYTTITEIVDIEEDLNEESENKLVKPPKPLKCTRKENRHFKQTSDNPYFVDQNEKNEANKEIQENKKILEFQLKKEFNKNPNKLNCRQYYIESNKSYKMISNDKIVKENGNQEKDNCMTCMGPNSKCLIF